MLVNTIFPFLTIYLIHEAYLRVIFDKLVRCGYTVSLGSFQACFLRWRLVQGSLFTCLLALPLKLNMVQPLMPFSDRTVSIVFIVFKQRAKYVFISSQANILIVVHITKVMTVS